MHLNAKAPDPPRVGPTRNMNLCKILGHSWITILCLCMRHANARICTRCKATEGDIHEIPPEVPHEELKAFLEKDPI